MTAHHAPPDWATFATCPTCHAAPGGACASGWNRLNAPHPLRDTTAQPSLFETPETPK